MEEKQIPDIETARLRLVCLSVACLRALVARDRHQAQRNADFSLLEESSLLGEYWVGERLKMIEADPSQHEWMYRAIVRKSDSQMLGHISFHHKMPDPTFADYSARGAELGYTIEPPYLRQGYATESAVAMMHWARIRGALDFFLTIAPANTPSVNLAKALGYNKIGEMNDPSDGIEELYHRK